MLKKVDLIKESIESYSIKSENDEIIEESKLLENRHSNMSQVSKSSQDLDTIFGLMKG